MPVAVAYLQGNTLSYEPGIFKRGTVGFNLSTALQGSYTWWNPVDQDPNKLLIYSDTFSTGASTEGNAIPSAWATTDLTDASLLGVINAVPELIGQPKFTNAKDALTWLQGRGIYFVVKDGYENIVTDSLVFNLDLGWYDSYIGSGSSVKDISSTGLNGTLYNSPTFNSSNGGGLYFDGTDDYGSFGSLPLNSPLSFTNGNFSLEHWIHPTGISSGSYFGLQNMIIMKGAASTFNYATQVSSATGLRFYHRDLNESLSNNTFTVPNLLNKTTHVVFVINSAGTQVSLYLDGTFYQTQNLTGNPITPYANDPLLFGGYFTQQYTNFIGTIYQLRIYGKALSADEIWQNYQAQSYRFGSNNGLVTAGLIADLDATNPRSYPGSGAVWYDLSGNGNNATINTTYHVYTSNSYFDIDSDGTYGQGMSLANFRSNLATAHTVEALIYPQNGQPIILAGTCGANNCWSYGESVRYFDRTGNTNLLGGFSLDNWQKVVLVFDGNNTATAYRNGTQVDINTNFLMSGISDGTAYIASRGWAATPCIFLLSYFRVYNRALSSAEILQNYYQGNMVTDGLIFDVDAANLVSYARSGTTWRNIAPTAPDATLTNGPTFSDIFGGVIQFDGSDDYAVTGNFPQCSNWTTEMFLYPTVFTTGQRVILDINLGIRFEISNGKFNSHFGDGGGWIYTVLPSTTTFAANTWYHVTVTVQSGGQAKIYVNGILENSINIGSGTTPNVPLYISRFTGATGYEFQGNIGIVRIYNKSLSQSEVIQNFNSQRSRYGL